MACADLVAVRCCAGAMVARAGGGCACGLAVLFGAPGGCGC